jgi:hypothetical protein
VSQNTLTGSVIAPLYFGPGLDQEPGNIVSGNLSTSDGGDIINVPRVSLSNANSLVINTDGNPNSLHCDTGLTFDGTTLNVVGEITASLGISASYLMGDGSRLTGITAGGGSGGGIFTEVDALRAYTTSSIQVGSSATPTHTLSVAGASFLSGAVVHKRLHLAADYTITTSDYYLGVDTSGGAVKLTLPQASALVSGQTFIIKDEGGTANTNNLTVSASAASGIDTIDGATEVILESPYASFQLYCDGASKYFIC